VNNQVGIIHRHLFSLLVIVMIFLGLAMMMVLFAPSFGKQFAMPIESITCEIMTSPAQFTIMTVNQPNIEECYKVEDVLALNKALRITETLSMFGLLLAIFALITPLLSYVTLKKEKESLENTLNKSKSELQESMEKSKVELKESIASCINHFPKLLSSIETFKSRYLIDNPRNPQNYERCRTEADEIALRLFLLLDPNTSVDQVFADIDDYITEDAFLASEPHIMALKKALRQIYNATYLGPDTRKAALSDFLNNTLKISLSDFLDDTQ